MSIETVQFIELAREAYFETQKRAEEAPGLALWCEGCGEMAWMRLERAEALDEIYRCPACGTERWYRVR